MFHLYLLYFILAILAAPTGVYWMCRSQHFNKRYPFFQNNPDARGHLLAIIIITGPISLTLMIIGIGRATLVDKQDFDRIWSW